MASRHTEIEQSVIYRCVNDFHLLLFHTDIKLAHKRYSMNFIFDVMPTRFRKSIAFQKVINQLELQIKSSSNL